MSFWSPCKQRLRRLMGTEVVKLTNGRYMDKLAHRVKQEYEEDQARREEELALEEIRREKELVLKGILETPYQPRKRHPLTRQVLGVGRSRESHTKRRKSSRKMKKQSTSRTGAHRQKHEEGVVGKTGQATATQWYKGKLFAKSTFGDVFQRLTSSMTSPITLRLADKSCDSKLVPKKTDHCQNNEETYAKQINLSNSRKRRKKKRRKSKTQRKPFRVQPINPKISQDVVADQSRTGLKNEEERTLVSQLQSSLFM